MCLLYRYFIRKHKTCFHHSFFTDLSLIYVFLMVYCFHRLFFRRHYPSNTVTFCDTDPQDRKWVQRHENHWSRHIHIIGCGNSGCYLNLKIYWQVHSSWAFYCLPHLQVEQTWGRHSKVSQFWLDIILPLNWHFHGTRGLHDAHFFQDIIKDQWSLGVMFKCRIIWPYWFNNHTFHS